jgi:hypothetical protein
MIQLAADGKQDIQIAAEAGGGPLAAPATLMLRAFYPPASPIHSRTCSTSSFWEFSASSRSRFGG